MFGKMCNKHPDLKGERYKQGGCVACSKDRATKWGKENPARKMATVRRWQASNPDKVLEIRKRYKESGKTLESSRQYRESHREMVRKSSRECARRWRSDNPATSRENARRQYYTHLLKYKYRDYRRRANKSNREFNLSFDQFAQLLVQSCVYCGKTPNQVTMTIDRSESNIGYTPANSQACCQPCNVKKRDMPDEVFRMWMNIIKTKDSAVEAV